jgi:hypothetical protein
MPVSDLQTGEDCIIFECARERRFLLGTGTGWQKAWRWLPGLHTFFRRFATSHPGHDPGRGHTWFWAFIATGQYWPFQDYGPWTNHMPLAFLIPGYAQVLFGPGLRTGRYLAVFLAALMLLGLWITVRRMGGRWWAAGALVAVALNPAGIKIYSLAISEVLIACMLVWVLALILGEDRPTWQVILGSFLAGLVGLSRLNLVPAVPVIFAYFLAAW